MSDLIRWVTPNQAEVDRFQELVHERLGINLTPEEAFDLALRYAHIFQFMTWEADEKESPDDDAS